MNDKIIKKLFILADKSLKYDEFPVAAVIFDDKGNIISSAYNKRNYSKRTIDHAEIMAIDKANKRIHSWQLTNMRMVVTLEPCDMCKTVIKESRLEEVYYIVPRYKFKKQHKCTVFENLEYNDELKTDYIYKIKTFFKDKR